MNKNKKTPKMMFMMKATVLEYNVHIKRNELMWKKRS